MKTQLKKFSTLVIFSTMLLTTACSSANQVSKKPNTMAPEAILETAKTEFSESLKKSLVSNLEKASTNNLDFIKENGFAGNDDTQISINLKAGEQGTVAIDLKRKVQFDTSSFQKLTKESTLPELIKGVKANGEGEIAIKAKLAGMDEISGIIKLQAAMNEGLFMMRVTEIKLDKDIPGIMDQATLNMIASSYINKWYKLDLVKISEITPELKTIFSQQIFAMNNIDKAEVEKLIDAYTKEVLMADKWTEVNAASKKETEIGDEYELKVSKEKLQTFAEKNYDFIEKNLETIDKAFGVISKNPSLALEGITVETAKSEIAGSKSEFMAGINEAFTSDLILNASFSGDKLVKLAHLYKLPENPEATGQISIAINFEEEMHNIDKSNIDFNAEINGKTDKMKLTANSALHKKEGENRISTGEISVQSEEGNFSASFNAAVIEESKKLDSLQLAFDVDSKEEFMPDFKGASGKLDFTGGKNANLKADLKSKPDSKFFSADLNGSFSTEEKNLDGKFQVTPQGQEKIEGSITLNNQVKKGSITFKLPEGAETAEDLTTMIQSLFSNALLLPGNTNPQANFDPENPAIDPSQLDQSNYSFDAEY
jgi:hypothetical protein